MAVKIITDSTADMKESVSSRVEKIPLTLKFGNDEFLDGVNITKEEFYKKLSESDSLPTTSQATPLIFKEKFSEVTKNGDEVVLITISSTLSGTYQSAVLAANEFEGKVFVIDSKNVSLGVGILIERGLELIDEGKSAKEVYEILEKEKENVTMLAIMDTLDYLVKGGRISKSYAMMGKVLSVKIILRLKDGDFSVLSKGRGCKNAYKLMTENIEKCGSIDFNKPFLVGYTGNDDGKIKNYIETIKDKWTNFDDNLEYICSGSIVGTHIGPNCSLLGFFDDIKK